MRSIAVRIPAVSNCVNRQGAKRLFRQANTVVADAEPLLARGTLELLDISGTMLGKAVDGREDVHCYVAWYGADGRLGFV